MNKSSWKRLLYCVLFASGLGAVLFVLTIRGGHARIHPFYICFPWGNMLYRLTPAYYSMTYSLGWLYYVIGLIQFPVYGALYHVGTNRWPRLRVLGALLGIHVLAVFISLAV
jgi:hypothetical protein